MRNLEARSSSFETGDKQKREIVNLKIDDIPEIDFEYSESEVEFPQRYVELTGGVEGYRRRMVTWSEITRLVDQLLPLEVLQEQGAEYFSNISFYRDDYSSENYIDYFENLTQPQRMKDAVILIQMLANLADEEDQLPSSLNNSLIRKFINPKNAQRTANTPLNSIDYLLRSIAAKLGDDFYQKQNLHIAGLVGGIKHSRDVEPNRRRMLLTRFFEPGFQRDEHVPVEYAVFDRDNNKLLDVSNSAILEAATSPDTLDDWLEKNNYYLFSRTELSINNAGKEKWTEMGRPTIDAIDFVSSGIYGFSPQNSAYKNYLEQADSLMDNLPTWESISHNRMVNRARIKNLIEGTDDGKYHPFIPVIIGHSNLPDLRWCHASTISLPTINGLNIIDIKSST